MGLSTWPESRVSRRNETMPHRDLLDLHLILAQALWSLHFYAIWA